MYITHIFKNPTTKAFSVNYLLSPYELQSPWICVFCIQLEQIK